MPLHNQIAGVVNVLNDMANDSNLNSDTVSGAGEILKQINFQFLCLLDLWCKILTLIDRENCALQSKAISVDIASKKMEGLVASIQNVRDLGVQIIIEKSKLIANQIGIESDFPSKRKRKVKRMALYEGEDEGHLLTQDQNFGSQCNQVLDSILTQLQWRFEAMANVSLDFEFLSGYSLSSTPVQKLQDCAANLAKKYNKDLDMLELMSEIESFKFQADSLMDSLKKATPMDLLQLIYTNSLNDAYPNIAIALRIFLTIPVTVASCERSFSKLKIIKNYLRSTMGQERLSNLSIISIEQNIAHQLNYDSIIDEFASMKSRKIDLK